MGDWPLIGVRFALYLALATLFGLSAFCLYGLRARERGDAVALQRLGCFNGLLDGGNTALAD
jgi:putative copper resistance protein D